MHPSGSSTRDSQTESQENLLLAARTSIHFTVKTSFGSAAVANGIPPEDYETWVAGFEDYPIDHRYYEIVHESLKDQFAHYYLLLKDAGGITRAIQPFLIVSQDLATGTPAFVRNLLARVRRHFPGFLKLRMLMIGCSAGEGDIVLEKVSRSPGWTVDALKESLIPVARRLKAVLIVFKDLSEILPPISGPVTRLRVYARAQHAGHETGSEFFGFRGLPENTRQLHDAEKSA